MQKLPRNEVLKILCKNGFMAVRQKGNRVILKKRIGESIKITVVPLHKEVDKGTLIEIIRQAGMKKEEFMELL